jgi:hypothetical protein
MEGPQPNKRLTPKNRVFSQSAQKVLNTSQIKKNTPKNLKITPVALNCCVVVVKFGFERLRGVWVALFCTCDPVRGLDTSKS